MLDCCLCYPEIGRGEIKLFDLPQAPKEKSRSFLVKTQTKPRENPVTEGKITAEGGESKLQTEGNEVISEKGKKKTKAEGVTENRCCVLKTKKERALKSNEAKSSNGKEQENTKRESNGSATLKRSVIKTPRIESQESSSDELAWDQDKAERTLLTAWMEKTRMLGKEKRVSCVLQSEE